MTHQQHLGRVLHKWVAGVIAGAGLCLAMAVAQDVSRDGDNQDRYQLLKQKREQLDETVWKQEVQAQRHEEVFIRFWDELRDARDPIMGLTTLKFDTIRFGAAESTTKKSTLEWGIESLGLESQVRAYSHAEFTEMVRRWKAAGYQMAQSEWHHQRFDLEKNGGARSLVSMAIHLRNPDSEHHVILSGKIGVKWSGKTEANLPVIQEVDASGIQILHRRGRDGFETWFDARSTDQRPRVLPLMVYDLNGDGLLEVIIGGVNRVFWNMGDGKFELRTLLKHDTEMYDAAILADFTNDGHVDLVCVGVEGEPLLFAGAEGGTFPHPAKRCAAIKMTFPKAFTAGDIDGDGDLDLFIGQYKFPYNGGQMPTPFYDANDGDPAYLLVNNGKGEFTDGTPGAGLEGKRKRRTYSASFVDLDDDRDLDLLVISDFAGVDAHLNDGKGKFTDVSEKMFDQRHLFGMSHTFGDFDGDGQVDIYAIGMSSTTARRLESMGLSPGERPETTAMRKVMGYGNRMLLRRGARYEQANINDQVARTGWSWGTTAMDVDNDGDLELYVVNGHSSGESSRDYCTRYWCHDIYSGNSKVDAGLNKLFQEELKGVNTGRISWNGYEKNTLYLNQGGGAFTNVSFLVGTAVELDCRGAVSADLDNDGRVDLLMTSYGRRAVAGETHKLHVYRNNLEQKNHWIGVDLREEGDGASPIGAKVTLRAGKHVRKAVVVTGESFSSQGPHRVHFGLGNMAQVDELTVEWPNGKTKRLTKPAVGRYHTILQRK